MPADLHLLRPYWLLALVPLALLIALWWRRRGDAADWSRVCDPALLPYLLLPGRSRGSRPWLAAFGLVGLLAILALSGPAWKQLEQPVFRDPSALVILLDLSRSMDSRDLQPSRLERARLKLLDILRQRSEGQTALVFYAAQAFPVVPLTDDSDTIAALAGTLDTSLMPGQGSRPDLALEQAVDLLAQAGVPRGNILLITDGAGSGPAIEAVGSAAAAGHRVHVLGVGTPEGAPIPTPGGGFLKDAQGSIVVPALDEGALRALATRGGGRYTSLSVDDRDLIFLLAGLDRAGPLTPAQESDLSAERWREEGPWLLLLALPLAALAFRRGFLILVLALLLPLPQPAQALEWADWWRRPDQQAADRLRRGEAAQAARFADAEWQAAAHYRSGAYEEAVSALEDLASPEALYNKGNALARAGRLQEALEAYDRTLELRPEHDDAAYNRELVEEALAQQKQPEPQQGEGESPPDSQSSQDQEPAGADNSAAQNPPENADPNGRPGEGRDQESSAQDRDPPEDASGAGAPSPTSGDPESQPQDPSDEAKAQMSEQARADDEPQNESEPPEQSPEVRSDTDPELAEQSQAARQWLRRIPDDPGGLLRRKFRYQYQRLDEPRPETQNW